MLKRLLFVAMLIAFTSNMSIAQTLERKCYAEEHLAEQMEKDPSLGKRMREIEVHTKNFARNYQAGIQRADLLTIPVVVHIIYSNNQQNISDAQVQSQIDVLNEDFRKINSDINDVPSEFAGVTADIEIEFVLASTDPNGNPTTGITRKSSSTSIWGTNDAMKRSSQGGVNPWDATRYLNMWVCNIGNGILGYAQFPGGSLATDGVVMGPQYFGSSDKGNGFYLSAPFDKGRTTTHEVGHWMNLRHIWGDGECGVDDFVSDTPTAFGPNYGCPNYPSGSCTASDMFMNYMDYVDDDCMVMFSEGQKTRMRAIFESGGSRDGFNNVSNPDTCDTPTGLAASGVTETTASLSWSAVSNANSYDVRYRESGTTTWTTGNVTSTSASLSQLTASTSYQAQVRSSCTSGNSSYSGSLVFTTSGDTPVCDGISSFPYGESFESGLGAWTQGSGDDGNWLRDSGGTPSSSTGPSSASAGSFYMYLESSATNITPGAIGSNATAFLVSPCFDLSNINSPTFSFDYSMYGSNMGSLALQVSTDLGASWSTVWSESGNQGTSWFSNSVDLSSYTGSVSLRFNGTTGSSFRSDMAIDNVSLSAGSNSQCENVTLSITLDDFPEETSWSIVDDSGNVVAEGGTYDSSPDGSTVTSVSCLASGCYTFEIDDDYGDGICCQYGNGSYQLTDGGGATIASGGVFGSSESTDFCLDGVARTRTASISDFSTTPNPAQTETNVRFKVAGEPTDVSLKVLDLRGVEMISQEFKSTTEINTRVDVSTLNTGLYLISIDAGNGVKRVEKLTVKH